jgi:hypothetical protein
MSGVLSETSETTPKLVFIVPYRDREQHKHFFTQYMRHHILADETDWAIFFAHQDDSRPFNRGAMKNIGFLEVKRLYPDHYRDMTFVFNDVDTVPCRAGSVAYKTTQGTVKHFYGFTYALGGFFSITGGDFEKTNGFPNYWGWGFEDNAMNDRVIASGIVISREQFYPIGDMNVIHLSHGPTRTISQHDVNRYHTKRMWNEDGLNGIRGVVSSNDGDTINISNFQTNVSHNQVYTTHRLDVKGADKLHARLGRPRGRVKMFIG